MARRRVRAKEAIWRSESVREQPYRESERDSATKVKNDTRKRRVKV
jgi:hypothetical protein